MPNPAIYMGTLGLKDKSQILLATHDDHIICDVILNPDGTMACEHLHSTYFGNMKDGFKHHCFTREVD